MNIDWLEDLLSVIDTGSFNAAAERRYITQPAFSRRVRGIEAALGTEIFDRSKKPVQLNPQIRSQEERIRTLAQQVRELKQELRSANKRSSVLTLASQHAISSTLIPHLLRLLNERDDLRLRLRSANRDQCEVLLLAGATDLVILYQLQGIHESTNDHFLHTALIGKDKLIPVVAADSVLGLDLASGKHQKNLPVVVYPEQEFLGKALYQHLLPSLRENHGIEQIAETALTSAAMQFAVSGLALAWVPQSLAQNELAAGKLLNMQDQLPWLPLEIVMQKSKGKIDESVGRAWDTIVASNTKQTD